MTATIKAPPLHPSVAGEPYTLNLDEIVALIRERHSTAAEVAQTGGGTATIYAGREWVDGDGMPRRAAIAGPGTYSWTGEWASHAYLGEFSIGVDDDGQTAAMEPATLGAVTSDQLAALIAAQANKEDPTVLLGFDAVEDLGLDGTARSLPAGLAWEQQRSAVYAAASNESNREQMDAAVRNPVDALPGASRRARNDAAGRAAAEAWEAVHPRPT